MNNQGRVDFLSRLLRAHLTAESHKRVMDVFHAFFASVQSNSVWDWGHAESVPDTILETLSVVTGREIEKVECVSTESNSRHRVALEFLRGIKRQETSDYPFYRRFTIPNEIPNAVANAFSTPMAEVLQLEYFRMDCIALMYPLHHVMVYWILFLKQGHGSSSVSSALEKVANMSVNGCFFVGFRTDAPKVAVIAVR